MRPDAKSAHSDDGEWVRNVLAEHERPLLSYCLRLVGDPETARDVVQDAFLRLIRQRRGDVEDHLVEWLYTVCRNRALDVMKKERRMRRMSDECRLQDDGSRTTQGEEVRERNAEVLSMLDALPPRQQEVIRLKVIAGLSYREISRVMNISVSNVGFLIHTGLKSIRERAASGAADADASAAPASADLRPAG